MTTHDYTPAITTQALQVLGGPVREALRTLNFLAAEAYIRDIIVAINHESAWCYDSDKDLPHMASFFATLHDACGRIRHEPRIDQRPLADGLLTAIDTLLAEMAHHTKELVEEAPPDRHLSTDEIGHRGRRYGDLELASPAVKVFD